jgi:GTP pyrophosphokinase
MDKNKLEKKIIANCSEKFKEVLKTSLDFARKTHLENIRPTGDLYFDHGLDTALKLQDKGFDCATVIGGLLHHIDLNIANIKYINEKISPEVTKLLENYNKIDYVIKHTDSSYLVATRYILNFVDDLRPVLIQLANAQSNSKILGSIDNNEERKNIVLRNLNIYSKLAEYLGLGDIEKEISEEGFRITQPEEYEYISRLYKKEDITNKKLKLYEKQIKELIKEINEIKIQSRVKSKYSTYLKSKKYIEEGYTNPIANIRDLIGFRIITKNEDTCFQVLDKIWEKGEILFDEFDDYITHPKPNGYKAMQGPVIFPEIDKMPIEIQILSKDMFEYNTYGPASHIVYKESRSRHAKASDKYNWVSKTHLSINKHLKNSKKKFSYPIPVNIFPDEKYPITPKDRIIALQKDDTVTDFAYRIHTAIGNSMIAVKVNNKAVSYDFKPKTGDIIEIITQKGKAHPKPELLKCANSDSTKLKINRAIK